MKRLFVLLLVPALALVAAAPALAQGAQSQHQHDQAPQAAPATPPGAGSAPSGAPHGTMPMAMCQEMMRGMTGGGMGRGMMGGGMMGMPMMGSGGGMDPKAMGQMIEMRAEMMKAMADVMLKHARRMQQPPATK
jgi:hypothetical protein